RDRAARQHGRSARRRQEAAEDAHQRRLAGAVRSQQADDRAPLDLERHVVERRADVAAPGGPVPLRDTPDADQISEKVTPDRDRARTRRPRPAGDRPRATTYARSPGPVPRRRGPSAAGSAGKGRWSVRPRRTGGRPAAAPARANAPATPSRRRNPPAANAPSP